MTDRNRKKLWALYMTLEEMMQEPGLIDEIGSGYHEDFRKRVRNVLLRDHDRRMAVKWKNAPLLVESDVAS